MRLFVLLFVVWGCAVYAQKSFPMQQYGNGGTGASWYSWYVPTFHTYGEFPEIGNTNFQFVSRNLRGGSPGGIWISLRQSTLFIPGLEIETLVDLSHGFFLHAVANGTHGQAGEGIATTSLPIPKDQALVGMNVFAQSFFLDTASTHVSCVYTQGLRLQFHQTVSPLISALYERTVYQKIVTDAATGMALWGANAVNGFSYIGTQKYSCGGQTHWMVIVKDDKYGIEFMLIPGGSFRMGDSQNNPIHWVHIMPFLLARTEITQAQWYAIMGSKPWQGKANVGPYPACAANWITWNEIAKGSSSFCSKTGWRLPSESEWEYACRAGTTTRWFYGNSPNGLGKYAWYSLNTMGYPERGGLKLPNAFGLYDMLGNAPEWGQDNDNGYYHGAPTNGDPWEKGVISNYRIIRGGGHISAATSCTCSCRGAGNPGYAGLFQEYGFRPALSLR